MGYTILTEGEFNNSNIIFEDDFYSLEYLQFIKNYYSAELFFLVWSGGVLPLAKYKKEGISILGTLPKTDVPAPEADYCEVIEFLKGYFKDYEVLNLRVFSYKKDSVIPDLRKLPIYHSVAEIKDIDILEFLDKKTRNQTRRSLEVGFGIRTDIELEELYKLYLENMDRHGTSPRGINYFQSLRDNLRERVVFLCALKDGELAGANIFYINGDYLLLMHNISAEKYWPERVNNFLYFKTIEYGQGKGVTYFDYGPSVEKDTTHLDFKKSFGGQLSPVYEYSFYRSIFLQIRLYFGTRKRNIKMRFKKLLH